MVVERKYERDIDLLLAEEFLVNPSFADWMKAKTDIGSRKARIVDVFVSKANNLGESDLIALYELDDGKRFALMIEDKVDAPLQPEQAQRYRLRAEQEVQASLCAAYAVFLCAPHFYLENCSGAEAFDGRISFEEIAAFLRGESATPRAEYRASFLESAATRRVNNWVREIDEQTEEFWEAAYQLATKEFPILEMKRLKVTKDSTWINFRPRDMPTQPRRVYIFMKGDRGQMDLTFTGVTAHQFHQRVSHLLEPEMTIHQTAASAAVRLEVAGFTISEGLEIGLPKLKAAFQACERLIQFYRTHRTALDFAATEASAT